MNTYDISFWWNTDKRCAYRIEANNEFDAFEILKRTTYEEWLAESLNVKYAQHHKGILYLLVKKDCDKERIERLKEYKFVVEIES